MAVCDVCGNESVSTGRCPYCGSRNDNKVGKKYPFQQKVVNLEAGRPVVEVALHKMEQAIGDARRNRISVLTLIHGYGSSGKGGTIKNECRNMLDYLKSKGDIVDFIPGEDFNKKAGQVKSLLQRYPQLGKDRNLNRNNRGITLVVIR